MSNAGIYYYWLLVSDLNGSESFHGPISLNYANENPENPSIPLLTSLKSIYPNPFNPRTTISYSLSQDEDVRFCIYNSRGQLVREYHEGEKAAGEYRLIWDAKDDLGREISTGVYFIRMQAGKDSFFKKAVLMK